MNIRVTTKDSDFTIQNVARHLLSSRGYALIETTDGRMYRYSGVLTLTPSNYRLASIK